MTVVPVMPVMVIPVMMVAMVVVAMVVVAVTVMVAMMAVVRLFYDAGRATSNGSIAHRHWSGLHRECAYSQQNGTD